MHESISHKISSIVVCSSCSRIEWNKAAATITKTNPELAKRLLKAQSWTKLAKEDQAIVQTLPGEQKDVDKLDDFKALLEGLFCEISLCFLLWVSNNIVVLIPY